MTFLIFTCLTSCDFNLKHKHHLKKIEVLPEEYIWKGKKQEAVFYCEGCNVFFDDSIGNIESKFVIKEDKIAEDGLPIVSINTEENKEIIDKENWIDGDITIVDGKDTLTGSLKIKGRGNSTWGMPKKPYNIKLESKEIVLGMPKAKKWAIMANYSDKTLLRNWYASYLGTNIFDSEWSPSSKFVNFILNDEFIGTYAISEKVELGSERVNGKYLLEVNARMDEKYNFKTTRGVAFSMSDPDDPDEAFFTQIKNYIQSVEDYIYSEDFANKTEIEMIDVDSFVDWILINELTKNNDAKFYSSVYMFYDDNDNKLHMGPIWDFDISCGNINYNKCDDPEGFWIKNSAWISRLFNNKKFVEAYKNRWNEKKVDLIESLIEIQKEADRIASATKYNFDIWPILGIYVWPNTDGYADRRTYQSEVDYLVNWLKTRIDWLDRNINSIST